MQSSPGGKKSRMEQLHPGKNMQYPIQMRTALMLGNSFKTSRRWAMRVPSTVTLALAAATA